MSWLKLETHSETHDTTTPDPDDRWDRASTSTSWSVHGLTLHDKDTYDAVINYLEAKEGDEVYALYAVYSTGDSFGHDASGQLEFINVFATYKDAERARDSLATSNVYLLSNGQEISLGYKPWDGYFESLDYMEIDRFVVNGNTRTRKYY